MLNFHRLRLTQIGLLGIASLCIKLNPATAEVGGLITIQAPNLTLQNPTQIRPAPLPSSSFPPLGETASSGGSITLQSQSIIRIFPTQITPIQVPSLNFPRSGDDAIRTRQNEPLIEEPFFEGLGVDVELTVQGAAIAQDSWLALVPPSSAAESGIVVQDLSFSLIGTTGETEQHFSLKAMVQNQSYEPSLNNSTPSTAQVLLMEGDRIIAEQTLASPLEPGQTALVQYQLNDRRPKQPWTLAYRNGNQTVVIHPQELEESSALQPAIPEIREQDLFD